MKIAVDTRELHGKPTGVGRLLQALLDEWKTLPAAAAHEFLPYAGRGTAWEQLTLPRAARRDGADLLFCPGYSGPIVSAVPMVVAIHDVSFAAHPEWFRWREGLRRRVLARLSAQRARRVITISQFSKEEIVKRLGVDAGKIDVAYPGFTNANAARSRRSLGEGGTAREADREGPPRSHEQLVLFVGSLFNRRHIPELMAGFARLSRERANLRLEIVGDNRSSPHVDFNQVAESTGAGDRIGLRSYLPDADLASLYARARVFVFLSSYEGFGLTPLEALAAGVPIVVLDTPVAREIYGSAALYVPRPDPDLIQAALSRVLYDEGERARILDAAQSILQRYSWRTFAQRVLDSLVSAAQS